MAVERLKKRPEFVRAAKRGRSKATPGLVLQVFRRQDGPVRVGYTASKKVGNAVVRNRARRRLRAVVGETVPKHASPSHDYVLIARARTVERPFTALSKDLEMALKHLNVWQA